ncbi:MAG: hypothetical protein AB7G11_12760 [Phycisphaerales bacterium]
MKLAKGLVVSAGGMCGLLAGLAAAEATPPVLDKVPTNAMLVIGVPNADKLQKNLTSLGEAVEFPVPIPAVDDMLAQMGAEKGVDKSKAVAIVIMAPPNGAKNEAGEPITPDELGMMMEDLMFVLMPTTNYTDFVGNFEAKKDGAVDVGSINGDDAFFRDMGGGYVAMSPNRAAIEKLDAKAANKAAIDDALGATGASVVDDSNLFVMINLEQARALQPMIMEQVKEQMQGNPAALALEGVEGGPFGDLAKQLAEQARTMVIGVRPEGMGVTLDMGWSFKPGSELADAFQGKGSTASLLSKLPNQPYFLAMAMDMSSPGVRSVVERFTKDLAADGEPGIMGMFADQIKASDGVSFAMGAPQGGLMGGVLTSTISYLRTSKPDGYVSAMQKGLAEINGKPMGPMNMSASFTAGGGDVAGTTVDTYAVKFSPSDEEDADPQIGMAMQIIFGPASGPTGYVAKVDGGVLQSYSKNSLLMSAAMKAAQGGDSLAADKVLGQVAERLPANRMMELYVGVGSLLDAALPLAAMGGVNIELEVPPNMPPIGIGLAGGDAGARLGIFVPTPVIKTVAKIAQEASGGGGMMEDDEAPANGGRPRDGQKPRF